MEVSLDQRLRFEPKFVAAETLHSSSDLQVILVGMEPGQVLPPTTSSSSVMIHVLSGRCALLTGRGWADVEPGTVRFYPPHEAHGIQAVSEQASALIIVAPRQ